LFSCQIQFKDITVDLPLFKKNGLDKDQLKYYRPVSNLLFFVETAGESGAKVAAVLLDCPQHDADTSVGIQAISQYGDGAVESVQRSPVGQYRGQVSALCLLEVTAAFDTVDHALLRRRLQRRNL